MRGQHFGRIDVLVNNAGMSPVAPSLLETSEALFDKIIDGQPQRADPAHRPGGDKNGADRRRLHYQYQLTGVMQAPAVYNRLQCRQGGVECPDRGLRAGVRSSGRAR